MASISSGSALNNATYYVLRISCNEWGFRASLFSFSCSFPSPVLFSYQPFFFNGVRLTELFFGARGSSSADDNFLMTDARRHDPS